MGFFQRRKEAQENREAMRFAKERFDKYVKDHSAEEAGDKALADTQEKFGAIDISKWMAILQLIMQLIEMFKKPAMILFAIIVLSFASTAYAGPFGIFRPRSWGFGGCASGNCSSRSYAGEDYRFAPLKQTRFRDGDGRPLLKNK
jgi:hypothetical protein